ncbi:MAG: helix-turn-helix transcriptional regulator [Cyanobium sp.]
MAHEETMGEGRVFGSAAHRTEHQSDAPAIEGSLVELGGLTFLTGRTTPIHAWETGAGISSITMCFCGTPIYTDEGGVIAIHPGDILANPRIGGRISTGYLASINFPIEHRRLSRTLRAMRCMLDGRPLERALSLPCHQQATASPRGAGRLFAYFSYLDSLLAENRHLGVALGLDDQIYRLIALALVEDAGRLEATRKAWDTAVTCRNSSLDDLVDYIRAHAHRNLTLTDLEEQSHYSSRHLQNLFQNRFHCTPMQFVRRQRLASALEKLQNPASHDTVTTIARDCGYRHTSTFSTDFRRQFGISPSTVLRRSRR